jgi:uncharacterized protein (DUF58 family)
VTPEAQTDWLRRHRKSIVLAALTAVAYLAAINRAQPFVWLVPALLVATLATGFLWPRWLVRGLTVSRSGPTRAEEGQVIEFRIEVDNQGWLPRFMVELVDRLPFVGLADPDGRGADKVLGLLAYLPGRRRQQFTARIPCEKRGFYHLGPVGLASSFPLGLAEARRTADDSLRTLTIYPEVFNILALPLRGAPSQIHRGGYLLPEGAGAAEFAGLREYRRGDNPRHVHWPTTARLNELMVREFEPLASACLTLAVDQSASANVGRGRDATFEVAVRIAASIARLASSQSIRTRLAGNGRRPVNGLPGVGDRHFQGILDELAVIDADGANPYARLLDDLGPQCVRGETVVVFLSGNAADWEETLRALTTLRARQLNVFAVVFDTPGFAPEGAPLVAVPADAAEMTAALLELGAQCLNVRHRDDLVRLFNA